MRGSLWLSASLCLIAIHFTSCESSRRNYGNASEDQLIKLTKEMKDDSADVRRRAIEAIAKILLGSKGKPNSGDLAGEGDDGVAPFEAVGMPGQSVLDVCIHALRDALEDPDVTVRIEAAGTLASLDQRNDAAMALLIGALRSDSTFIVTLAANRLSFGGRNAKAASSELLKLLRHHDPGVRTNAAQALRAIGGEDAIPAFILALEDPDEGVAVISAEALRNLGPAAKEAIPALTKALKRDGDLPVAAATALVRIDVGAARAAVREFISVFEHCHPLSRVLVAHSLGEIGPAAKSAVPALLATLKKEEADFALRVTIIQTLSRIGPGAAEAALIEIINEGNSSIQEYAIQALDRIRESKSNSNVY